MTKGVAFTKPAARRIAAVVRRVEGDPTVISRAERGKGNLPPTQFRPIMLKAQEAMVADDTEYDAKYLEADGTEGKAITVRRPNGIHVGNADIGFLGKDSSRQHIWIPGIPLPLYDGSPDVSVGTTAETEAAQTDDWDIGDGTLTLTTCTRVAYDDGSDENLYAYYRDLSFDAWGRLTKVGTETRVVIDAPESCA